MHLRITYTAIIGLLLLQIFLIYKIYKLEVYTTNIEKESKNNYGFVKTSNFQDDLDAGDIYYNSFRSKYYRKNTVGQKLDELDERVEDIENHLGF